MRGPRAPVNRSLVENLAVPALHPRTSSALRDELDVLRDAEGRSAHATADLSERRAIAAARSAGVHSPWFRRHYRGHGAIATAAEFRALPIVTREMVRLHADEMVRDGVELSDLRRGATSDAPPSVIADPWRLRAAAVSVRADEWAGWRSGEVHVTLVRDEQGAARVRDRIHLPCHDLSDAHVDRNLARLRRAKATLLSGHASDLVAHARRALARDVTPQPPRAVVATAGVLSPEARDTIERAFRAPLLDRYGSEDLGVVAQECYAHAGLHVASEHVHVEIDAGGRPAVPGETGRVLVTLLGEPSFPFVRYDVGDTAVAGDAGPCACGLPFPRIARVVRDGTGAPPHARSGVAPAAVGAGSAA